MPAPAAPSYDLFISHAAADRAWVEGYLAEALRQAGLTWHAEAAFPADQPRLVALEQALQESRRVVLILSPAYLAEGFSNVIGLLARHYGPGDAVWPVSPILLEPVTLPARLPMLPTLDASDPRKWPRVINRLCSELGHPLRGPVHKPPCPYPGLRAFGPTDVPRFYGRDADIGLLLGQLRHGRLVLVAGPSGAGKTSLVQAGLLPQLPASLHWPPGFWLARTLRPGAHPVRALARVLDATHGGPREALTDLLAGQDAAGRLLLVIDPLEEVFTLAPPAEQEAFMTALQELRADARCALVLVMRDDFYPDLMTSALWPIGVNQRVEVAPLRGSALRQAIQQPALLVGVQVESDLLSRLLADAAPEPDPLPLIQETLVGLWSAMEQRLLTLRPYQQVTRGPNALAIAFGARVDAAFRTLGPEQQAVVARLLLRLVQPGAGRPDTSRPQTVGELSALEEDATQVGPLLRYLAANGLVTLDGPETEAETTVDLAHETLLVRWPRLRGWLRARHAASYPQRGAGQETSAGPYARVRRPVPGEASAASARENAPVPPLPPPPAPPPMAPPESAAPSLQNGGEPGLVPAQPVLAPLVSAAAAFATRNGTATMMAEPSANGSALAHIGDLHWPVQTRSIAPGMEPPPAEAPIPPASTALLPPQGRDLPDSLSLTTLPLSPLAASLPPDPPAPITAVLDAPDMITIRPLEQLFAATPTEPPLPEAAVAVSAETAERAPAPGLIMPTYSLPAPAQPPAAAPAPPAPEIAEEHKPAREQAIETARARLAHLAILRAEEDERYAKHMERRERLHRLGGTVTLVVIALALALGVIWLLAWGGW